MKMKLLGLFFTLLLSSHAVQAQMSTEEAISSGTAPALVVKNTTTGSSTLTVEPNKDDTDEKDDLASYTEAAAQGASSAAAGSIYNSCTANPFALCSGPMPSKKNKFLRNCWIAVCP